MKSFAFRTVQIGWLFARIAFITLWSFIRMVKANPVHEARNDSGPESENKSDMIY